MPKGTKTFDLGVQSHWFECACGHRWQGGTQRAKDLAFELHGKRCEYARDVKLQNQESDSVVHIKYGKGDPITRDMMTQPQCVQNVSSIFTS